MENFNERLEIMLFFKTCFLNFDLQIKDFRNVMVALGKAFKKTMDDEEDEEWMIESWYL